MKKIITVIALALACLVPLGGCAALASALPAVIAAVVDAAQIIDAIERFVSVWFANHPDVDAQKKVGAAIVKTRMALNVALRLAQGTEKANDQQIDQAFDDFKKAYLELIALCKPYGVSQAVPGSSTFSASPDALVVPEPLAFQRRK